MPGQRANSLGISFQGELGQRPGKSLSLPGTQFSFLDDGAAVKYTVKAGMEYFTIASLLGDLEQVTSPL